METKTRFCDVCGIELKTPARVDFQIDNFGGEVRVVLNKLAGAYADFCADCMKSILNHAVVKYGDVGTTRWVPKDGGAWHGFNRE